MDIIETQLNIEIKRIYNKMEKLSYLMESTDEGYNNFDALHKEWEKLEAKGKKVLDKLQKYLLDKKRMSNII